MIFEQPLNHQIRRKGQFRNALCVPNWVAEYSVSKVSARWKLLVEGDEFLRVFLLAMQFVRLFRLKALDKDGRQDHQCR